ncbi:hypothetical protein E2C01_043556 [Portunus trituberculatus]|uniref:Uncharacterized protein n=1 Tax=Portunus trituberculatus TaxID=210409 RepID=A0A5B7FZW2_PORTR|nr:hypothetical protein [Portunus trituberculatus]
MCTPDSMCDECKEWQEDTVLTAYKYQRSLGTQNMDPGPSASQVVAPPPAGVQEQLTSVLSIISQFASCLGLSGTAQPACLKDVVKEVVEKTVPPPLLTAVTSGTPPSPDAPPLIDMSQVGVASEGRLAAGVTLHLPFSLVNLNRLAGSTPQVNSDSGYKRQGKEPKDMKGRIKRQQQLIFPCSTHHQNALQCRLALLRRPGNLLLSNGTMRALESEGFQAHRFESCPQSECRLGFLTRGNGFLAGLEDCTALPPEVSCHGNSRRSATGSSRDSMRSMDSLDDSQARLERVHDSRMRRRQDVNKPVRRTRAQTSPQFMRKMFLPGKWS